MSRLGWRTFICLTLLVAVVGGIWVQVFSVNVERVSRNGVPVEVEQELYLGQKLYLSRCAACHGEVAEGDKSQMAGALASMPRWYLVEQLSRYRDGLRGAHPEDIHGLKMRAVVESLDRDEQAQIIDYLVSVPPIEQESTLGGDSELGRELFDVNCAKCHRYNGHGMSSFKSAPLNGQQDWYLFAQMSKFDQRLRGYHEEDTYGWKMHGEMDAMRLEEDRLAVLAYLCGLSAKYPMDKEQDR